MSGYQNPALNSSHSSQDTVDRQLSQYPAPGSSEWQAQTGTYQPRSRVVASFTQLKAEIDGIRAHFTSNPAYTLPSQDITNVQMTQLLTAMEGELDALAQTRGRHLRGPLANRFLRGITVVAVHLNYKYIAKLLSLRLLFIETLKVYNANSQAAQQQLSAHVSSLIAQQNMRESNRKRQISEAATTLPLGYYAPSTHSFQSQAYSTDGSAHAYPGAYHAGPHSVIQITPAFEADEATGAAILNAAQARLAASSGPQPHASTSSRRY